MSIFIDLDKAKNIAHIIRREKRKSEFEPYDEVIMKQIPTEDLVAAEEKRKEIREKYILIQDKIDNVIDIDNLKNIINDI